MLHTITEYGYISTDEYVESYNPKYTSARVCQKAYEELEAFAKTAKGKEVFVFARNGRYLQAQNYVGTIQTVSGYTFEILPKIYNGNAQETKAIFVKLLTILYKLPEYKHIGSGAFAIEKKPVLEIFITMFLEEVGTILKKGIKSDYIAKEENERFLKGKLLISKHTRANHIHKERFFVEYDDYSPNRAENKLIKSTLLYLLEVSRLFENKRRIRQYLEHLHLVERSQNYESDFKRCDTKTRGMQIYKNALIWARVFLAKESFTQFFGETIAFALLYPMERLFENYVEHYLKRKYRKYSDIQVYAQTNGSFVKSLFGVRPDFLIKKDGANLIIADVKWKLVDDRENLFSQSDFYQLFAYDKVFKPKKPLRLYYPMSESFTVCRRFEYFDETKIIAIPLDMKRLL